MKDKILILTVFLALIFLASAASALSCGDTITESITLTENMTCSGTAITVDADNVVIDGNGHTLEGDGTGYGIYVSENIDVVVKNLVIRNFEEGIIFIDDIQNSEVYNNVIEGNANGLSIIVFGVQNKIHDNEFRGNERGMFISIFSNGNEIYHNKFIHNSDAGVRIMQSRFNVFYNNQFIGNTKHADDLSHDNSYDNGVIGNYWNDYEKNSGFPNNYVVNGNSIDHYPFWFQAKCGDVNADGKLTRADINYLVGYVFGGKDAPMPIWAGDVNGDNVFNVIDVVTLINHVIRGKPAPTCGMTNVDGSKSVKIIKGSKLRI